MSRLFESPPPVSLLASVTPIASSMPAAPIWLPRRARVGEERNLSARMKLTIETR